MTRYFFDIDDGEHAIRDDEGSDFASAEEARWEGIEALTHIVKDALPDGNVRDFKLDIREGERVVFKATISLRSGWVEAD